MTDDENLIELRGDPDDLAKVDPINPAFPI